MRVATAGACVLLFSVVGCERSAAPDVNATRAVLDSIMAAHGQHIIQKDVDGVMDGYTEDAVVRANHAPPLRGRPAIRSFVEGMFATVDFQSLTYTTEALAVYGDSAWHIVDYGMTASAAGQPMADSGSAYLLWVRDTTGSWRVKDDILNSRIPLPPPPVASSGPAARR